MYEPLATDYYEYVKVAERSKKALLDLINSENLDKHEVLNQTLFGATTMGSFKAVKNVLSAGADVHAVNDNGMNVLHLATKFCCHGLLKKFLNLGVDVNVRDLNGMIPLDYMKECISSHERARQHAQTQSHNLEMKWLGNF